jgi:hypothetical protein
MYRIVKKTIEAGGWQLHEMLERIERMYAAARLTGEEHDELVMLAREKASYKDGVDVAAKLKELEERIRALEEAGGDIEAAVMPEYVAGKWYYAGDKVMFDGAAYVCAAPEGTVCVWSPEEMPGYWERM